MMVLSELSPGLLRHQGGVKPTNFSCCTRDASSGRKADGQIRGALRDVNAEADVPNLNFSVEFSGKSG
jgi:hypothetical protein